MNVKVTEILRVQDRGSLRAFVTVVIGPWTIGGCRIIQQPGQGTYVALPQHKAPDGRYYPMIRINDTPEGLDSGRCASRMEQRL